MLTKEDLEAIGAIVETAVRPLRDDIRELKDDVKQLKEDVKLLKADMLVVKTDIGILYRRTTNIMNFQQIESTGIEEELSAAVLPHIRNKYPTFDIDMFDLKVLYNVDNNQTLTDLDGCFVATPKEMITGEGIPTKEWYFFIVEAKHYVTFDRINEKLEQLLKIKRYFEGAKTFTSNPSGTYGRKFEQHVKRYNLASVSQVHFYIGGPVWEKGSVTYMNRLMGKGKPIELFERYNGELTLEEQKEVIDYMRENIGAIVPHGVRYNITDGDTFGGSRRRKKAGDDEANGPEMVILKNNIRWVFT